MTKTMKMFTAILMVGALTFGVLILGEMNTLQAMQGAGGGCRTYSCVGGNCGVGTYALVTNRVTCAAKCYFSHDYCIDEDGSANCSKN